MIDDILTTMWKERKTLFRNRASRSRLLTLLLTPVMLSTVFPVTWGPDWVEDFPPLIIAVVAPAVLVAVMIPDSFAGERERHTLPTLLASRLPDRAILLGKMIMPVAVGWGTALLCALLSLVIVNIAHGEGTLLFYTPPIALGILGVVGLVALAFFTLLALPGMAAGYGLLKRKQWGRILALIVGILDLFSVPLGTLLGLYTLFVLLQEEAEPYFGGREAV